MADKKPIPLRVYRETAGAVIVIAAIILGGVCLDALGGAPALWLGVCVMTGLIGWIMLTGSRENENENVEREPNESWIDPDDPDAMIPRP